MLWQGIGIFATLWSQISTLIQGTSRSCISSSHGPMASWRANGIEGTTKKKHWCVSFKQILMTSNCFGNQKSKKGSSWSKGRVWTPSMPRQFRLAFLTSSWSFLLCSSNQAFHVNPGTCGTLISYVEISIWMDSDIVFLVQNLLLLSFSKLPCIFSSFSASKIILKIFWFLLVLREFPFINEPVLPT